jgi:hypothetical protein
MPFTILSVPVIVVVLTSIAGISISALGICLALTVSWMPIVNAVSAILIVPNYRQWVMSFGRAKIAVSFICFYSKYRLNLHFVARENHTGSIYDQHSNSTRNLH